MSEFRIKFDKFLTNHILKINVIGLLLFIAPIPYLTATHIYKLCKY